MSSNDFSITTDLSIPSSIQEEREGRRISSNQLSKVKNINAQQHKPNGGTKGLAVKESTLKGVLVISPPTVFEDFRGDYVEIYNRELYHQAGITADFKQDDYATSRKHVLRGMHGDNKTEKLVKCVYGSLYLVVVQADETSPQFMQWEAFTLTDRNRAQVYVPAKYAIGYLVLSDVAIFHYKQSAYYHETEQFTIKWDDPRANIWWPVTDTIRSQRDL